MHIYLAKSTIILGALLLFYKLILEKEPIHRFKRFFLLGSILLAIAIPFITFTNYVEASPILAPFSFQNALSPNPTDQLDALWSILLIIYGLGVLVFTLRFSINFYLLFRKIALNKKVRRSGYIYILLKKVTTPHTFFNYIFFNRYAFESNTIQEEVKLHEQAHARQLHSLDILFIELLQIILWFNPLVYILKNTIKLNHEFLADSDVLKSGIPIKNYQHILLKHSYTHNKYPMANAINYSSIKKRFNLMKTQTPLGHSWLKTLLLLPLLIFLVLSFSSRETKVTQHQSSDKNTSKMLKQDKASPEQIAQYNKLAKHYNSMSKNNMRVHFKDVERLKYIYGIMTKAQRSSAQPFPDFPPPPTAANEGSNEGSLILKTLRKKFLNDTNTYTKAVMEYRRTKKNPERLKKLYKEVLVVYEKFAYQAQKEKIRIQPPPPPPPID